ncbi:MAG: class 3 adenylate cyclase [bacterium]|jgi:class 3 adenylate cyclase
MNLMKKEKEDALILQLEESKRVAKLNQTFEKFVSRQFINHISAEGVENIEFGRAESDKVSVLFSDIRSFSNIAEMMSPQEVLNFLNSYFKRMSFPIHQHHGFIDKFIGDAIMALFDDSGTTEFVNAGQNSVLSAIDMQKELMNYNQHRHISGYPPITNGIGIHTGTVVIGTVGTEERMESTVLGDVVNLASRLEGLTKFYQNKIIISEDTYEQIKHNKEILVREIDYVSVKGKVNPVHIYEVFNADLEEIRKKKSRSLSCFQEGLALYHKQYWTDAMHFFHACLQIYPDEYLAKMYIQRCSQLKDNPPKDGWDGILRFEKKW